MRLLNVFSVFFLIVVLLLIPRHEANASERSDFVGWALKQGKGLDTTWDRITAGAPQRARRGSSTATVERSVSFGTGRPVTSNVESGHWTHTGTKFIHKGEVERFPLSTRTRSSPGRGVTKMHSPAKARLGISHDYRRIPNAQVPKKHFFHDRSGRRRIVPNMGSRFSPFQRRSRGWARPAIRPSRPRRSR